MWDHEVDVLCIGAGMGGLAGAIAAVDAGHSVLVAGSTAAPDTTGAGLATRRRLRAMRGWLPTDATDPATADYFAGFAEWVPETAFVARNLPVPTRAASMVTAEAPETFVGSRLTDWAAQCLTSPYGIVFSHVSGSGATTMRAADGGTIEVTPLGSMSWRRESGAPALRDWMAGTAAERGVDVLAQAALERLVFDDGRVVGAVLATATGRTTVRARRGVTLAPSDHDWFDDVQVGVPADGYVRQVCLVGRTASRFGRVELLDTAPPEHRRPLCTVSGRTLRAGLHDTRTVWSALRCGKVHADPAPGE